MKSIKTPQKGAGTKLRELAKKRRESMQPSRKLIEVLETPQKNSQKDKKSALTNGNQDMEI